jgi:Cu/Ag efflux pump CusA
MMTMLVATLGLLPAALSYGIGSIRNVHLQS